MSGTIPFIPYVPQIDNVREIMPGCLLYIYEATTVNPVIAYKDINLTVGTEHPWPIPADSMGRIPMFWLPDGMYRVRLTNASGSFVAFDLPAVPALGASSGGGGGGGGGSVSPDVIFQTGDVLWLPKSGTRDGWVRLNARTLGNSTSGATERANADTQSLYEFLYSTYSDTICPVLGGRGASATADFSAGKQLTLLDFRFIIPVGLDDMGGSAAGRAASVPVVNGSATAAGSTLGAPTSTLVTANLPPYTPAGNIVNGAITATPAVPVITGSGSLSSAGPGSAQGLNSLEIDVSQATSKFTGTAQGGTSTPHNNTPLVVTGTYYVKL